MNVVRALLVASAVVVGGFALGTETAEANDPPGHRIAIQALHKQAVNAIAGSNAFPVPVPGRTGPISDVLYSAAGNSADY